MRTLLLLAAGLASAAELAYREAAPGYRFSFPRDHFEHPEFRTEWWYYTGNVRSDAGRRYGFELVFFRQAPAGRRSGSTDNPSAWRVDDLYLAHVALTDIDGERFRYHKRLNRAGPGIAGASFAKQRIWNGNWSAQWSGEVQMLLATTEDFRFRLRLVPRKPPVIHGRDGWSQKAAGRASHYVSFSRLAVDGEINGQGVKGTAWMDHEWFTHQLDPSQVGWDWFSVQLNDGVEVMLFQLRRKDGSIDPYSAGTYINKAGRARHLAREDFELQPVEYWKKYPVRWRMRVPSLGLSLECAATLKEQELKAEDATGPSYWEGAVTYAGSHSGVGYLEMTGYDKPVRLE